MISLNEGSLFYANDNRLAKISSGILYTDEIKTSNLEEPEIHWMMLSAKKDVGLSFEIQAVDLDLLEQISKTPTHNNSNFTLTHKRSIMIQARWHKRHRINKKWLKRYGMKPDMVEVSYNAKAIDYDLCNGSFDINTSNMKYNFKPHQKRRNLRIEL